MSNINRLDQLKLRQAQLLEKRKLELLAAEEKLRKELPHLYQHKFYPWQREFFDSKNPVNVVCAANQIGKSTTGQKRLVANATDIERRKRLFPKTWQNYRMQWYFYPDSKTLEREWNTKWIDVMPRGEMKNSMQYGWNITNDRDRKVPYCINWNSGITTYFMYYSKEVANVQASSPHEIFCDEEMPVKFYDELMMRMISTYGVFNMFYTPTLNQMFWKRVMQKKALKDAFTREVSMYDCLLYEDGSPSTVFTRERVKEIEGRCQNEAERQRRVYGKHVAEGGRLYYGFDENRNITSPIDLRFHFYFGGMDYGSGGEAGHPSAIVFIAVAPDYRSGVVFRCWRGDGIQTTAGDVVNKFVELRRNIILTDVVYDHSAKDLETIASRTGLAVNKANKQKDYGDELLNTLLLSGALKVVDYGDVPENIEQLKLMDELSMLMVGQEEGDDLADALRYTVCSIPWDYEHITSKLPSRIVADKTPPVKKILTEKELLEQQIMERRGIYGKNPDAPSDEWAEFYADIEEFNKMCE